MPFNRLIALGVSFCVATFAQPALANDSAEGAMRVSARVPALCMLTSATTIASEDRAVARSTIFEICNTNRGFQVVASHRPLAQGERADVTYDGLSTPLGQSGLSVVQFRQGARHGPVDVRVATEELQSPLAISFSMTPV